MMKKVQLIVFLLFASFHTFSQTNGLIVEIGISDRDEFTKEYRKATIVYPFSDSPSGLTGLVGNVNGRIFFSVKPEKNIGCTGSPENYVIFLFTDGTTYKVINDISKADCTGESQSAYTISTYMFKGKKVAKIRVKQTNGYEDFNWTCPFDMNDFINAVKI